MKHIAFNIKNHVNAKEFLTWPVLGRRAKSCKQYFVINMSNSGKWSVHDTKLEKIYITHIVGNFDIGNGY